MWLCSATGFYTFRNVVWVVWTILERSLPNGMIHFTQNLQHDSYILEHLSSGAHLSRSRFWDGNFDHISQTLLMLLWPWNNREFYPHHSENWSTRFNAEIGNSKVLNKPHVSNKGPVTPSQWFQLNICHARTRASCWSWVGVSFDKGSASLSEIYY